MRNNWIGLACLILFMILIIDKSVAAQPFIEYLGLSHKQITALDINYGILAAGTEMEGVFRKFDNLPVDTVWSFAGLDSVRINTVYPHQSGALGWSIGAGIQSNLAYPDYIYCSFVGGPFIAIGLGLNDSLVTMVYEIDGFPDPGICGETYAATGKAIFRRNLGDSIWVPVYIATPEGAIVTIKAHFEHPGLVLAGGAEGFAGRVVMRSFDYGNSWEWLSAPALVRDLDFAGDSAQTIFVLGGNDVYRSLDAGNSWTKVFDTTLLLRTLNQVSYHPGTSSVYIAGSDDVESRAFLWRSTDLGDHWQEIPLALNDPIYYMEVAGDGLIFIAAPDAGVFRIDPLFLNIEFKDPHAEIFRFQLEQNYPNPFNRSTIIRFNLATNSEINLEIVNLLGQKIQKIYQGNLHAGNHKFPWNGDNYMGELVPSGIYFIRLTVENDHLQRRILLLK